MDYWAETMQDDVYLVAADGWKAETTRVMRRTKMARKGQRLDSASFQNLHRPLFRQRAGRNSTD
jgi:hypothetical protein